MINGLLEIFFSFSWLVREAYNKKSHIRETPNLLTNANRSTDTEEKNTRIALLRWGIWLSGGGLLCNLQQSPGLHFYPLNYTALLSYAMHFTEKL